MKARSTVGGSILPGSSFLYAEGSCLPENLRLKLKERINRERLQKAVDQAVLAHHRIVYGICLKDGAFYYHDSLTKTIRVSEADWEDLPPSAERAPKTI